MFFLFIEIYWSVVESILKFHWESVASVYLPYASFERRVHVSMYHEGGVTMYHECGVSLYHKCDVSMYRVCGDSLYCACGVSMYHESGVSLYHEYAVFRCAMNVVF
jgi:hypothetical protein